MNKYIEGLLTLLRFWMLLWTLASRNSRISSCSCQNMPALDSFSPLSPLEEIPTMTSRIRAYQLEILLRGSWTSKNSEVMVKPTHRGLFIRALRIPMFATLVQGISTCRPFHRPSVVLLWCLTVLRTWIFRTLRLFPALVDEIRNKEGDVRG